MDRHRIGVVVITFLGMLSALVLLSLFFDRTSVPAAHYEIGWAVKLIGCALMAWRVRLRPVMTLLLSAGFLVLLHYSAFYVGYAVLNN